MRRPRAVPPGASDDRAIGQGTIVFAVAPSAAL